MLPQKTDFISLSGLLSSRHHEATTRVAEKEHGPCPLAAKPGTAQAAEASKQSRLTSLKDIFVLTGAHFSIHFMSGGIAYLRLRILTPILYKLLSADTASLTKKKKKGKKRS